MNVGACCQWCVLGCWRWLDWQSSMMWKFAPGFSGTYLKCVAFWTLCSVNNFSNCCRQQGVDTAVFVKMQKTPTWKPYLNLASDICCWSKHWVRLAIRYQSQCTCGRWVGCRWAGVGTGAPGGSGALQLWVGMDRRNTGARAGHEGPAAKCFEKERVTLFQCNDFVLPQLILSVLVRVKHRSIQVQVF